ncbi:carboxymuconolactone decarboxylase family protein [Winogradskya humida]|uniref:Carboxymuconolactone decarboxylase n=1 Tax=Winogradskya humida TaxID=113566 RepID=A0ABQ4A143_9ACTN|nr:carboxymuconolactone decarboxylase family protein [Actinoplanes humidus]GIE24585.1 carboxymuconolactone decarboxylase [Actinoplanes humidus]
MSHISLPEQVPGLIALAQQYPDTAGPLFMLAEAVLRGPSPLTAGERELIASYVSERNESLFCTESHRATARFLLPDPGLIDRIGGPEGTQAAGEKLAALLAIADAVAQGGTCVTPALMDRARQAGADERTLHDTVLTAAIMCMYNRYVDGLGAWAPEDPNHYTAIGESLGSVGYTPR